MEALFLHFITLVSAAAEVERPQFQFASFANDLPAPFEVMVHLRLFWLCPFENALNESQSFDVGRTKVRRSYIGITCQRRLVPRGCRRRWRVAADHETVFVEEEASDAPNVWVQTSNGKAFCAVRHCGYWSMQTVFWSSGVRVSSRRISVRQRFGLRKGCLAIVPHGRCFASLVDDVQN